MNGTELATPAPQPAPSSLLHDVSRLVSELYNHASSMVAQRVLTLSQPDIGADHAEFARIGLGHVLGIKAPASAPGSCSADAVMRQLPLHSAQPELQQQQHLDDGHLWAAPNLAYLPWGYADSQSAGAPSEPVAAPSTSATASASSILPPPSAPTAAPYLTSLSDLHAAASRTLEVRLGGLAFLWHAAVSLQQRVLVTALWHFGHAAGAAERARRSMPPPHAVPDIVHWAAASAAVHAEESLALALARTAGAASAAAAGVPAAAAVITGSAAATAAAAAAAAPHLPLLRAARRRLLGAALPLLEQLRWLQRGCTTHVLLRFMLFSSLHPRLRREILMRLDVLARRAGQLALLQEQHDAWMARQPAPPGAASPTPASASPSASATSAAAASVTLPAALRRKLHPLQSTPDASAGGDDGATAPASSASAPPAAAASLSARWYRGVFAPEMQACGRRLTRDATASSPPEAVAAAASCAAEPPPPAASAFDLRDLYRLIRVLEVAVEDLQRYG